FVFHRPAVTAHQDEPVRQLLLVPGLVTLRDHAPGRHRMSAARGLAGAATHRMVDRVLRHRTAQRPDAAMTAPSRLAQNHVLVLGVAHLPDRRVAILVDPADFARRQANLRVTVRAGHQRGSGARGANHLTALAGDQFDIMNRQTNGDRPQRQIVPEIGSGVRTADDFGPDLQADRRDDVTLLAVFVLQQRQAGGAARIVFDCDHVGLDLALLAFEIHVADLLLVALADSAAGDATVAIATAGLLAREHQALLGLGLRDLVIRRDRDVSRGRRQWSKGSYWHKISALGQRNFLAFFQGHDGLLPTRGLPRLGGPLAAILAPHVQRVHLDDVHLEQLLHRLANLHLVRARIGHHGVLVELLALARSLLGQAHGLYDVESVHVSIKRCPGAPRVSRRPRG